MYIFALKNIPSLTIFFNPIPVGEVEKFVLSSKCKDGSMGQAGVLGTPFLLFFFTYTLIFSQLSVAKFLLMSCF